MEEGMKEFLSTIKLMWAQKEIVDEVKKVLATESTKLEGMKKTLIKTMEAAEIEKQHVPGVGTVFLQRDFSVKVPKETEDKVRLFSYIAETHGADVLLNLQSINSMTLNSFYKQEMAGAKKRMEVDWTMPGIVTPEVYYKLGTRKA